MRKPAHLVLTLVALGIIIALFAALGLSPVRAAGPVCDNNGCYLIHTTTDDFVRGEFYATGLRKLGNGEVQLLPVGLSTPWQATNNLPVNRAELALVSYENILYAIGGFDGSTARTEIYSATTELVGGDIIADWVKTDDLPAPRAGASAVVARLPDPVLYVLGGGEATGSNTIYYKKIGAGGSLGATWKTATLPENLVYSALVYRNSNLYVIGGTSTASENIYRVPIINTDGDIGTIVSDLPLPKQLTMSTAVDWQGETDDFIYVLGGLDESQTSSQDVYITDFNPDNSLNNQGPVGGWDNASLVDAFNAHGSVQYNGAIYVVGGRQGISSADAVTKVQTALIDPDGSLHNFGGNVGNWIITEPLPKARFLHGTTVNGGGELYIAGGYNSQYNPTSTVYHGSTTGAASTYAPEGEFIGAPMDAGVNSELVRMNWNAAVEDISKMGLTMYYRSANSLTTLRTRTWILAGTSAQSSSGVTNTVTFPSAIEDRYFQYRGVYNTEIYNKSPLLSEVTVDILGDPTHTPTNTATATSTDSATDTPTPSVSATATPTDPGPSRTPTPTATGAACEGKPGKPVLVSPNNSSKLKVKKVKVAWNAVPCATEYKVIVRVGAPKGPKLVKKGGITKLQFKVKKLKPGTKYFWRIKAINAEGMTKSQLWKFKIKR